MLKNKKVFIVVGLIIVIAVIIVIVMVKKMTYVEISMEENDVVLEDISIVDQTLEYTCVIDTQEEAEEVAQAYGIELVSFEYGIALFSTNIPYSDLIKLSEEKGLPMLSVNGTMKAFEFNK